MSPLILLLFTTDFATLWWSQRVVLCIWAHSTQVSCRFFGLSKLLPIFLNWTPKSEEKFFHQKRENLTHFHAWKGSESLSSSFYQRTGKKQHIFGKYTLEKWNFENTLPENTFSENTFSENMLIIVIIMIVMVTMVIMVIKVVRVTLVMSMLTLSYSVTQ